MSLTEQQVQAYQANGVLPASKLRTATSRALQETKGRHGDHLRRRPIQTAFAIAHVIVGNARPFDKLRAGVAFPDWTMNCNAARDVKGVKFV